MPDNDPLASLIAEADQYAKNVKHLAPALAAEYLALVDEGVPALSAAVIVGQRWRMT